MRITSLAHRLVPATGAAIVLAVFGFARPPAAFAQTPAGAAYERAQADEQAAVAETPPSVETLRKVAREYESLVRKFPVSGYADNALWQAAGLYDRVFSITSVAADRDQSQKYLTWLQKEYPHSPFAKQAAAQLAAPAPSLAAASSATERSQSSERQVSIRGVTRTALPHGDRVTIELSGESAYTGERVSNPDRVFFDFANATAAAALAQQLKSIQSPLIKAVRVGSPSRGVARVVLELIGAPKFSSFTVYGPFRLVVDVESNVETSQLASTPPATTAPAVESAPPQATPTIPQTQTTDPPKDARTAAAATSIPLPTPAAPASTKTGDYSLARQLGLRVSRIVIDAGHGGHDPGAQSNGVTEAELVLDVALRLEKLLTQVPGVEVVLTRRTNEFIPLEERTAIANRQNADLFLSIHANAHRQPAVRGIESYFLNFATNADAEAVAARENAASGQTMGTLPTILKAIALNNKLAESREFAGQLQTALVRRLRQQSPGIKDFGVKQAPFVVLIGAQMPSVLTEIAFLTNRADASLLKQSAYRQQIAQALKEAVVRYQESLKKVTTVAVRERER